MGIIGNIFEDCLGEKTTLSYSCIPKIENNCKDISYNNLKDEINRNIISIKKHDGSNGFPSNKNLQTEYRLLQKFIDYDDEHYNNLDEGVNELCRYSDVRTYTYNKVAINTEKKYINASPINLFGKNYYFISTQGPIDNTIEDFWAMIDQYNCKIIIMLCKLKELERPKCAFYWNPENKMEKYTIVVSSEDKIQINNTALIIRKMKLINNKTKEEKEVTQLHYEGWPDHGAPNVNEAFEVFEYMIKEVDKLKGDGPGVVHCSAGVGRTGTFISIYGLYEEIIDQINNNKILEIKFSIFNIVRKLKEMRLLMVQTVEQYIFIYNFIDILLKKYNK